MILVESLGLFQDRQLDLAQFRPFETSGIKNLYTVDRGEVPFSGNTISGEFRELCGIKLFSIGHTGLPSCLPAELKNQGYHSVAVHGFSSQVYNRFQWYPHLGFDHALFAHHLFQRGLTKKCGSAFRGLCDTEVSKLVHGELLAGTPARPKFIYWLTLNSHLPLDMETSRDSHFNCESSEITHKHPDICRLTRTIDLVFAQVAKIAQDPLLPPTEFILVGDHAPPFYDPMERSLFSAEKVPFIHLKPRTAVVSQLTRAD